jgi:Rv0078B-related antitoxin
VDGDSETPGDRLMQAFEMFEFGVEVMAASLRRRYPTADPEQIERLIEAWLADRPGAALGDGDGIPVQLSTLR